MSNNSKIIALNKTLIYTPKPNFKMKLNRTQKANLFGLIGALVLLLVLFNVIFQLIYS